MVKIHVPDVFVGSVVWKKKIAGVRAYVNNGDCYSANIGPMSAVKVPENSD